MEIKNEDFEEHTEIKHNIWNYVFFMHYIFYQYDDDLKREIQK